MHSRSHRSHGKPRGRQAGKIGLALTSYSDADLNNKYLFSYSAEQYDTFRS